jgi:hypothetical protein
MQLPAASYGALKRRISILIPLTLTLSPIGERGSKRNPEASYREL